MLAAQSTARHLHLPWKTSTASRPGRPRTRATYHLQITVQVRPARPPTSRAPNAMDTKDAFGSLPESGARTGR